ASLLVGGVGVAAAVRAFVARKRDTIAILKCLGATSRLLLAGYLVQAAGLGLVGSLAGALLGVALAPLVGSLLSGLVPLALETRLEAWGLLRGVAIGTGLTMLIALWPLGEVRAASPSLLFRRDVEGNTPWPTRRWLAALPLVAGAGALVLWQAVSLTVGAIFLGAVAAALLVLALLARARARSGRSCGPGSRRWMGSRPPAPSSSSGAAEVTTGSDTSRATTSSPRRRRCPRETSSPSVTGGAMVRRPLTRRP